MPESLRVLYVSSFGDFRGGGQRSLSLLIQGMKKAGVTPVVAAPEDGDFLASMREDGIETHVIPLPRIRGWNPFSVVGTIKELGQLLKKSAVQLIHTDGPRATLLFRRASRSLSLPLVFHVRVSTPEPQWYERILAAHADVLACVSNGAAERFSGYHGGKVVVIPNGVDLDLFNADFQPAMAVLEHRKSDEDVLIGEVAFLMPAKGQEVLLAAAAALPAAILSRLKLLFIGAAEPDYLYMLQRKVDELELTQCVSFMGPMEDIRPILAGLDAVALPSESEGLPRSLIEAAAMKLPLIASDIPGCRDVVINGENGYLCPVGDVDSWSRALRDMILGGGRVEMGAKSRKMVEDRFDAREVSRRILEVYEGLIEKVTT